MWSRNYHRPFTKQELLSLLNNPLAASLFLLNLLLLLPHHASAIEVFKFRSCIDKDTRCRAFAATGFCSSSISFMKDTCPESCFFCQPTQSDTFDVGSIRIITRILTTSTVATPISRSLSPFPVVGTTPAPSSVFQAVVVSKSATLKPTARQLTLNHTVTTVTSLPLTTETAPESKNALFKALLTTTTSTTTISKSEFVIETTTTPQPPPTLFQTRRLLKAQTTQTSGFFTQFLNTETTPAPPPTITTTIASIFTSEANARRTSAVNSSVSVSRQLLQLPTTPTTARLNSFVVNGADKCIDQDEDCEFWASEGECKKNPDFMKAHCRESCGLCKDTFRKIGAVDELSEPTPTPSVCVDAKKDCKFWSDHGECEKNAPFMRVNCAASCGTCTGIEAILATTTATTPTTTTTTISVVTTVIEFGSSPSPNGAQSELLSDSSSDHKACKDKASHDNCKQWAAEGECDKNPNFMRENCKKSCDICSCKDGHEFCNFWAGLGECENNSAWMKPNCMKSCNACVTGSGSVATSASTASTVTSGTKQTKPPTVASDITDGDTECRESDTNSLERVVVTKEVARPDAFGLDFVRSENGAKFCVPQTQDNVNCQTNMCFHLRYRSMDGTCNNFKHPIWGASFTQYLRLQSPIYDDGVGAPVASISGTRPSPREIVRHLLSSAQVVTADEFNMLLMQWGQFVSHDIGRTTMLPNSKCVSCTDVHETCIAIPVQKDDPNHAAFNDCVRISRNAPICGVTPRQQLNENTAFVDGSQIYGQSLADMAKFRDSSTGFLKLDQFEGRPVLPFNHDSCHGPGDCKTLNFQAGDDRVNLFVGLSSMHILMAREHNRIASELERLNPSWDGDRLFHESRKIVGAEIQAITYKEWLPKVLGSNAMSQVVGAYKAYNPTVNPSIANHFMGATFRFGHGMLVEFYQRLNIDGTPIEKGGLNFLDAVLHNDRLQDGGLDPMIRGLLLTAVKRPHRLTTSITEKLFGTQDLASINVERGRDHGLPSYNSWREFCKLPKAKTMDDLSGQILNEAIRKQLEILYTSPDNIDLYAGLLLEDPIQGALVGPTLSCLVADQMKRIRDGDRFWYQNPGVFTLRQLAQLEKSSMARILCDNGDSFSTAPADAFTLLSSISDFTNCKQIPSVDLVEWKE